MLDLMGAYRVVDFAASVDGPTTTARVRINGEGYERRVVKADALVAVLAETDHVERGLDAWHKEVPGAAPNRDRAMAVLYTGDRLCSSSTWWNTGNPRNLVEVAAVPITYKAPRGYKQRSWGLWRWLASRHEPVAPSGMIGAGAWFRAEPEPLVEDVLRFVREGRDPLQGGPPDIPEDGRDMLYLAEDGGGEFVKLGKCEGRRTSPPERRVAMYAPANPRGMTLRAAWICPAAVKGVEQTAKAELRRLVGARGALHRAEWFQCTAEEGVCRLTPLMAAKGLIPR
jgi:hypothetical protein